MAARKRPGIPRFARTVEGVRRKTTALIRDIGQSVKGQRRTTGAGRGSAMWTICRGCRTPVPTACEYCRCATAGVTGKHTQECCPGVCRRCQRCALECLGPCETGEHCADLCPGHEEGEAR